jgi:hypothetical protein
MGLGLRAQRLAAQPEPGPSAQTAADRELFESLTHSRTDRGGGAQSPRAAAVAARQSHGPDPGGASCSRGPGRLAV